MYITQVILPIFNLGFPTKWDIFGFLVDGCANAFGDRIFLLVKKIFEMSPNCPLHYQRDQNYLNLVRIY